MKANVRAMPRVKHRHNHTVIVSLKGKRVRYGCSSCPAIDPYWYSLSNPLADLKLFGVVVSPQVQVEVDRRTRQMVPDAPKTSGWLSGSEGSDSDPQGPSAAVGFTTVKGHRDEDGARVIDRLELLSVGLDPGGFGTVDPIGEQITDAVLYDNHTGRRIELGDATIRVELPAEPQFTLETLQKLKKKQLQTIAVTMDVKHNTKTTIAELISGILVAQELPTLLQKMGVRELKAIARGLGIDKPSALYTHAMFVQVLLDNKRDELIKMFTQEMNNDREDFSK